MNALDVSLLDGRVATEIEWLVAKGYAACVEQAKTDQGAKELLERMAGTERPPQPWLLLTPAGVKLRRYLIGCVSTQGRAIPCEDGRESHRDSLPLSALCLCPELTPHWENRTYDLWAGPILVKSYRRCAPNQMEILDAFQQQGWPRRIDNPLRSDNYEIEPQQQLHDTVKDLNRSLDVKILRFRGDGTSRGVMWEFCQ